MRIEEIEKGQQEMQENIFQMTKMVTNLTKGKWITNNPSLQVGPTLRKDPSGRSEHINVQQKCNRALNYE